MDLAFLTPRADHDPSLHATRVVIGKQTASRRTFIIRVWANHEQRHTRLITAIGAASDLHVLSSLCTPFGLPSPLQVDRGGDPGYLADHTGGVPMPGEVFRHIHISRPQAVDGAITQA